MKKFFAFLAIAGFLTACNDADNTTTEDTMSTTNTTIINDSLNAGLGSDSLNLGDTLNRGTDSLNP